jgi:hypothetical protein
MQDASDPLPSQAARKTFTARPYPDERRAPCPAQISNRNTPEFRISPNPNKTQRIPISNRNNNPDVAVRFSARSPRLSLTNEVPHSPANPFLITDPRLETAPKRQKTKACDDF